MLKGFIHKIQNKEAVIGIVGLGYVGLPLLLRFAEVGFRVLGIDVDEEKNRLLQQGKSYIQHISSDRVQTFQHHYKTSNDFALLSEADAIILCVPTPLNKYREPDLSFVLNSMQAIVPYLRPGQLLSLESTTYPGTTEEELKPRVEACGLTVGDDFFLVHSPEREDPGNAHYTTATIPKICGGDTENCQMAGYALYSAIVERVVKVSSSKVAEMTKLLENIHRSVNIGLVNEMKILANKMSVDIFEVIDAAATKPFGFVPYYPGPGIGGHCIPIDPFYLTWKAREYGMHTRFIELAGEINSGMPQWVVRQVSNALNHRERSIKNSRILVLGIAYKCNIDDVRESPSIEIMHLLHEKGADIAYSDPHVPTFPIMRVHSFELTSVILSPDALAQYDCVILATAHAAFDYAMIAKHAQLIIDTRGIFRTYSSPHIVSA